jgi:hypothetical protein
MVSYLMLAALQPVEDGTLGGLLLGAFITFLLSRRKGRTALVSLGWALLSGGVGYFFGAVAHLLIGKSADIVGGADTSKLIPKGSGHFTISASGWAWIEPIRKLIEKKIGGIGD